MQISSALIFWPQPLQKLSYMLPAKINVTLQRLRHLSKLVAHVLRPGLYSGFGIRCELLEFGVSSWNSVWAFGIRCELSEFGVSFQNSVWAFGIRCELSEFGVSFWNSVWTFGIRCELLEFGVNFRNSVWAFGIRCELLESGVHLWATVPYLTEEVPRRTLGIVYSPETGPHFVQFSIFFKTSNLRVLHTLHSHRACSRNDGGVASDPVGVERGCSEIKFLSFGLRTPPEDGHHGGG